LLADEGAHELSFLLCCEVAKDVVAFARNFYWDLVRHGCSRRARASRECEDMQVGERQVFHHTVRLFELRLGFAWESDHYVRANGGCGHGGANFLDLLAIVPGTIFAMHAAEHGITTGLHGNMRVLGDARRSGHQLDEGVGPVHGFDRGDAEFFERCVVEDGANQILELRRPCKPIVPRIIGICRTGMSDPHRLCSRRTGMSDPHRQITTPAAEIDSGDYDFAIARVDKLTYLSDHFVGGK